MGARCTIVASAALGVVLALCGACGESRAAGTIGTPSASAPAAPPQSAAWPSPSSSPTNEVTERPPVMANVPGEPREITFGKHFFDTLNCAVRTCDVDPFRALGAPGCSNCEGAANWIADIYEAGGHIEDGLYKLMKKPFLVAGPDHLEVVLKYIEGCAVVKRPRKGPEVIPECKPMEVRLTLRPVGKSWLVEELRVWSPC